MIFLSALSEKEAVAGEVQVFQILQVRTLGENSGRFADPDFRALALPIFLFLPA